MPAIIELLDVYHASGTLAYRAPATDIHSLVRVGLAEYIRSRRRLYGCRLFPGPVRIKAGTKFSHNYETPTNPRGVWELAA